ncbi:hypothetical protein ACGF07_23120 [Kitasatospora sp. NPDC048194]|uniref:hypothetical protein n=1 Tax=Kitasatospora sp. NPDC048194 TaxID=3364045 RepID=UPI00371ECC35
MRTRQLLAAVALSAAAVLPTAAPAAAHGDSVHLEVTGQQNGHVSTEATWENDHDPVTEEFAGTLSATAADGRSVGPWRLVAVPGHPGTYTTRELLPAGHWRVSVDCAFPSLGHGERELDVEAAVITDPVPPGASPTAGPTPAGPTPATAGPTAPTAATAATTGPALATVAATPATPATATGTPGDDSSDDATTWAAVGTAAAAVLLVAAGFRLRRRTRG